MKDVRRPSVDEYFLKIASVVAERATCLRHHVGAVAVRNKHILSTGYNGAPAGLKDCLELGCLRNEQGIASGTRHEICRGIHAEQNVIVQSSLHGITLEGSTIYATHTPCVLCAKMLINAKIARFVTFGKYADDSFIVLFKEAGIAFAAQPKPPSEVTFLP
jgi:dCMP deaminase